MRRCSSRSLAEVCWPAHFNITAVAVGSWEKMLKRKLVCIASIVFCWPMVSSAALFSDDFNSNSVAQWNVNKAGTAASQTAEFAYDYSGMGIPVAPHTTDGTRLGLRLRANLPTNGSQSGLSLSPTGQHFGSDFAVTYDLWANFVGANNTTFTPGGLGDNANSSGGTQFTTGAIGTAGTTPQGITSIATPDSVLFAGTGDGGSGTDYRVYAKSTTAQNAASGVYAPGTGNDPGGAGPQDNANDYYEAIFPSQSAPAAQQTNFPQTQTGQTQAGVLGFAWHTVVLTKTGNIITWDVDSHRIATFNASALTLGGDNFAIGQYDFNNGSTNAPELVFGLIDHLHVDAVPEPASIGLILLGGAALLGRRKRA